MKSRDEAVSIREDNVKAREQSLDIREQKLEQKEREFEARQQKMETGTFHTTHPHTLTTTKFSTCIILKYLKNIL